MKNTTHKICYI